MTAVNYCPFSVSTLSQALLSRPRCCLRQARTALSPSLITARQWRDTSRAQASRPCWADAAEAIKTNEVIKRILIIWLRLTSAMRAIRFRRAVDVNAAWVRRVIRTRWQLHCVVYCGLLSRDNAESEMAKAQHQTGWRNVLVGDAVMFGSHWLAGSAARCRCLLVPQPPDSDCELSHSVPKFLPAIT